MGVFFAGADQFLNEVFGGIGVVVDEKKIVGVLFKRKLSSLSCFLRRSRDFLCLGSVLFWEFLLDECFGVFG